MALKVVQALVVALAFTSQLSAVEYTPQVLLGSKVLESPEAEILFKQGDEFYVQGEYGKALSHFDAAIELAPGNPKYWYLKAFSELHLKESKRGVASTVVASILRAQSEAGDQMVQSDLERLSDYSRAHVEAILATIRKQEENTRLKTLQKALIECGASQPRLRVPVSFLPQARDSKLTTPALQAALTDLLSKDSFEHKAQQIQLAPFLAFCSLQPNEQGLVKRLVGGASVNGNSSVSWRIQIVPSKMSQRDEFADVAKALVLQALQPLDIQQVQYEAIESGFVVNFWTDTPEEPKKPKPPITEIVHEVSYPIYSVECSPLTYVEETSICVPHFALGCEIDCLPACEVPCGPLRRCLFNRRHRLACE